MSSDPLTARRDPPAPPEPAPEPLDLLGVSLFEAAAVTAAFTTRRGGVSAPPFDTLNLERGSGDAPERIQANRTRVLGALGWPASAHVEAAQVHGRAVVVVGDAQRSTKLDGVDGLVTRTPGVALAVHAADCVPILLWDASRGAVGAVHAGWRGTAAGVVAAAVEQMAAAFGTDPADLRVALGPAIGPCHYEVDAPVVDALSPHPWAAAVLRPHRPGHWMLDLADANRQTLLALGVPAMQIWSSELCTACRPDLFFSHRRDGVTGRQGGLIGLQ